VEEKKTWAETFASWDKSIRGAEASFINFISAVVPWGAPFPVAYMSFMHQVDVLEFPWAVAIISALVIEFLGVSTVSTILGFWSHNRKYQDEKKKSPVWVAVLAFCMYLFIVLTTNVALDATKGTDWEQVAVVAVRAFLTLMTIPAALIMGVRALHQESLTEAQDSKRERAFKKHYGDQWFEMMYGKGSAGSVNRTEPTSAKKQAVMEYLDAYYQESGEAPKLQDIMRACGVAKSTASDFRKEWADKFQENN
jgi:hypothetical protein